MTGVVNIMEWVNYQWNRCINMGLLEKMSYRQMSTKEVRPLEEFKKVECEKTGTIYYEHPVSKERQWRLKSTKEKKK